MIHIVDLVKTFYDLKRGEVRAVDGINLHVPSGSIFGLLGPNGAGKTTTLRILGTVLQPTSGTAEVCGINVERDPVAVRRNIGYLSSNTGIYERMTPRETIRYFGTLYGLSPARINQRIEEIFDLLDMREFADSMCQKLSSGQKQKVSIARTIVHDPPVLIFDEPTVSLDVLVARDVVEFIAKCKSANRCVILSTHIMSEAEKLCDHVAIIDHGRIVAHGEKAQMLAQSGTPNLEEFFFSKIERRRPVKKPPATKSWWAGMMAALRGKSAP